MKSQTLSLKASSFAGAKLTSQPRAVASKPSRAVVRATLAEDKKSLSVEEAEANVVAGNLAASAILAFEIGCAQSSIPVVLSNIIRWH